MKAILILAGIIAWVVLSTMSMSTLLTAANAWNLPALAPGGVWLWFVISVTTIVGFVRAGSLMKEFSEENNV